MYDYGTTATFLRLTAAGWEPGQAGFAAAAAHHPNLFAGGGRVLVPQEVTGRFLRLAADTTDPERPEADLVLELLFGDAADAVLDESFERGETFAELHDAAVFGARSEPGPGPLGEAVAVGAYRLLCECAAARVVVGPFVAALADSRPTRGPASAYELYQQAFEAAFASRAFAEDLDGLPALLAGAIVLEWLWPWACLDNPEGLFPPDRALGGVTSPVGATASQLRDLADDELIDDDLAGSVAADLTCRYLDALGGDDPWLADGGVVVGRALIDGWRAFRDMATDDARRATVADRLPVLDRIWCDLVADSEAAESCASTAERVSADAYLAAGWPERAAVPLVKRGRR